MLDALTSGFAPHEWRWLGAVAVEQAIARPALAKLRGEHDLDAWLGRCLRSGLLVAAARDEVRVRGDLEQLVLRRLASTGELEEIARRTGALLEGRSVSHVALALQRGDMSEFERRVSLRRLPRATPFRTASEALRASVCEPFDAEWLARTWGERAIEIVARVLGEALVEPSPCDALYEHARGLREDRGALEGVLFRHAVLRGDRALLAELVSQGSGGSLVQRACARLLDGDVAGARALVEPLVAAKRAPAAQGAVGPVVALLLCARGDEPAFTAARRVLAEDPTDEGRAVARAFRLLAQHLRKPASEPRRLDVHQLDARAGFWELLLHAFDVHLHVETPWTRTGWAQRVAKASLEWRAAGYAWLAGQGLALADALSGGEARAEPSLWDLVAPKPSWRKALDALAEVSASISEPEDLELRVTWYVDMSDGSLARPALQERRREGGFGAGQRTSIAALWARSGELPPEDARVVLCSREVRGGRELLPEAYELLIGHPRVVDGARGARPIQVVRGSCRVVTEEDEGSIRLAVEPEGARSGVYVEPEGDDRLVVYRVTPVVQRVIDLVRSGVRIPTTEQRELLRVLSKLSESIEVRSPLLGAERDVDADATPCVRIAPAAGAWLVQIGVRPFGAKGRFFLAGTGRSAITLNVDGERLRCTRDLALERARVRALIDECPTLSGDDPQDSEDARDPVSDEGFFLDEASVLALLAELRDAKTAHAVEWPESTALRLRGEVSTRSLRVRLRAVKGWYLATGGVRVDDVTEVSLGDLVRAPALANGRFLRLPGGDYLEVEHRVRAVVAALSSIPAPKRSELAIHPGALETLRAVTAEGSGAHVNDVDEAASAWLRRIDASADVQHEVPASLRAELRAYQVEGYRWLCRLTDLGLGACLADDMGLGKTVQILALLLAREAEGPALVVAPTSVCGNWVREIERFAPSLRVIEYAGEDREAALERLRDRGASAVLVCSYAILQQDVSALEAIDFATAVLDEAQLIKNPESLRARAAFRIRARRRVAATGTPVENHYGDLWSIFRFLGPGLLGDWPSFRRRFVQPIESGASGNAAEPGITLRRLVQPFVLRRTKREVLAELPKLTEVQLDVELPRDDALRYALLRKRIHEKLFTAHGRRHDKLEILAELSKLRRFCCHPRLVFPDAPAESAKIRAFLELAEELRENGHRALVFSQYVDFLSLVREQLDERAIPYEYLDGSTPRAQRQARVDAFQRGHAPLFLISVKAGGFGLNLTAADYVIHLDPWWNPAVEAQATDRAHRIGQERPVTVYRLVTKATIEASIVELHAKKRELAHTLLDGRREPDLDVRDLVALIGDDERE